MFFFLNKLYVVAKQIIRYNNPYYWNECPQIKASINYGYISCNTLIEEVTNIKKLALIRIENKYFLSNYSVAHLFN